MAMFTENDNVTCTCGNDTFTEVEVFRIVKKPVKTTLTHTIAVEKEVLGKEIQCTKCKTMMPNPFK